MTRKLPLFVLVSALWGSTFVAQKVALRYSDPVFLACVRAWGAGGLLLAWAAASGRRVVPVRRDVVPVLLVGGVGLGATGMFLFLGLDRVGAGLGSMLLYTFPLWTAILATVVLREPMQGSKLLGLGLGFAGVVLLAGATPEGSVLGAVLVLVAAVCWAGGSVLYKRVRVADVRVMTAWSLLASAAVLTVATLALEGLPDLRPTRALLWSYLYMTVPGSAGTWALWFTLLGATEAGRATAFLFMTPAFGVLSGWVALSERVTWVQLTGGALVAAGVYLVARSGEAERPAVPGLGSAVG